MKIEGGSILQEVMEGEQKQQLSGDIPGEIGAEYSAVGVPQARVSFFDKLLKKSPDKPIDEYIHHPLNYDEKKSTGRIIRGLEGLMDSLNFAIVDILMGLLEKWKERSSNAAVHND